MWGVWGRALSHPPLPALWTGCGGPLPTGCGCGGMRAWGPVTNPTARALASCLCAPWGRHEGVPGGRPLPGCGAFVVGRPPTPDCPPSGRAAGAHYPLAVGARGVRAWGPVTNPTARAYACGGGGLRAPGGGASCLGVGRPGSGALPLPTARPLGGLRGPTTHWLWMRGVAGVWTRHQPHSARFCVLWGRHEGARGGRLLPGCGASGVGRSPTPHCPPSGRAAGAHYQLAVGAGGCGRGDPSPTRQRGLLRAGFARCGGGTRAPGGGATCPGVRRPGSGAPPPPTARLWAGCRGPLPTGCGCGGVRAWGPVTNPTARAPACCGGGMRVPGGAPLAWVCASGAGRSPTPVCPPSGRAAGAHYPLAVGAGGAGVGTRHQPHSARSWGVRAWGPVTNPTARALACCGGGTKAGDNAALVNCARTPVASCSPPGSSPFHSSLPETPSSLSARHVICQPHHGCPPAATLYLALHPGSSHTARSVRIWTALSASHLVPTSSLCCSCNTASPPAVIHTSSPHPASYATQPFLYPPVPPHTPSPASALLDTFPSCP